MVVKLFYIFLEKIKKLFSQYGYKVRSGTNLNKAEILAKVKRYSEKTNSGSFICFLSSHGDLTSLSCPDGNEIEIATILNEAKKREIQACPKIFFIDACRKYELYITEQFVELNHFLRHTFADVDLRLSVVTL